MSKEKSKSIAHMMVTLDEEYDFNDACAVDGSYLGRKQQASYGIWRGRGKDGRIDATSGAMPPGATIQDAEMLAILECAKGTEERLRERGDESAPRLLVLSDCMSVLWAIERGWRSANLETLQGQKRRGVLEELLLTRSRWVEKGGAIVMQWVPSHEGVYANAYADATAKAGMGREVAERLRQPGPRRGNTILYKVRSKEQGESWLRGEDRITDMARQGTAEWVKQRMISEQSDDRLIIKIAGLEHLWPWKTCWEAVLAHSSSTTSAGGHLGKGTISGSIMKLRAGYVGLREDYDDETGQKGAGRVAALWNQDGEAGRELYEQTQRGLVGLSMAIEEDTESRRESEWRRAVKNAVTTVKLMRETGDEPEEGAWRELRAVASCALPQPTNRERRATAERARHTPGAASTDGEEGEAQSEWAHAVKAVVKACGTSARGIVQSAEQWRDESDESFLREDDDEQSDYELAPGGGRNDGASDEEQEENDEPATAQEERKRTWQARSGVQIEVGGECGQGENEVLIRITRGTSLGNPFQIDYAAGDPEGERAMVVRLHRRWLEAGNVPADEMTTEDGAPLKRANAPKRGSRESKMRGDEQIRALQERMDQRDDDTRAIRFTCSKACNAGALCHGTNLAEIAEEYIASTTQLTDRQTLREAQPSRPKESTTKGGKGEAESTEEAARERATTGGKEDERTQKDARSGKEAEEEEDAEEQVEARSGEEAEDEEDAEVRQHTGADESGNRAGDERTGEERAAGVGGEERGPKRRSKADGADTIGIVSLLRFQHGNKRPMSEAVRRNMERTGCGKPWMEEPGESGDQGHAREEIAREPREDFGTPTGGKERAGETEDGGDWRPQRMSTPQMARSQRRDEEWGRREFGWEEETREAETRLENDINAIIAGDDEEAYARAMNTDNVDAEMDMDDMGNTAGSHGGAGPSGSTEDGMDQEAAEKRREWEEQGQQAGAKRNRKERMQMNKRRNGHPR